MKRINLYIIGLILLMGAGFQSCELKSEMYDVINPLIYPQTARDARDLVTSNAYGAFRNSSYDGLFNVATGWMLTSDIATDYGFCSWGGSVWDPLHYGRFTKAETRNSTHTWDFLNEISKMTLTIDRISGIDMNEDLKNQYIAELRCGRGFLAFLVWNMHGPIIVADLETLKNPLDEVILPRMSEEETRNYIVTELTEAMKHLVTSYKKGDPDYGRFTKGLCHMVLLKFYMQTKQWDKAITEARELQKPEYGYALVTDPGAETSAYANIFTEINEKNAETIWSVNCMEGYQTHLWYPHALTSNVSAFSGGWGGYKMTWKFFKTYEEGDQRKETIIYEYTTRGGITYNEANKGTGSNSLAHGVLPMKYKIEPNVGDKCQTDWIVYRYADVLTLLAEAIVRKDNTVTTEAIDLLNQVRTRAGLPAYTAASFSNARDFLDKLLMERAHEFYYEGCRRMDLIRDGSYVSVMNQKSIDYGQAPVMNENHHLFPLAESVIVQGKGLIEQNPGY
ncbi:RagB/SusD family nutrient uptake outer membrane protein [Parabacteroides sp. OttesenSCG-928-K15]|nr:RagB/SusD family nutrient uptake outer membrane protein [Parabacteroides sp. OttesenSCG-928-K15]